MRSRKEIKADFERTFPQRKEEQLNFQRQKLLLEAIQNLDEKLEVIIKHFCIKYLDKFADKVKKL